MNALENFNRLYTDISDRIGSAMADILSPNIEHKEYWIAIIRAHSA